MFPTRSERKRPNKSGARAVMKSVTVDKTCYMCKHLATNVDEDGYRYEGSDYTPPTPFKIFCRKDVWSYYEGPSSELREALMLAHSCSLYDPIPAFATPISPEVDYVGHIPRLPYCKSCGGNLLTRQPVIKDGKYTDEWISFCPYCNPNYALHPTLDGVYRVEEK